MTAAAEDVFLTDFGLAKDLATGSRYTRTGQTLGTPAYMSPEQARGEIAELAPASDVWALGCLLYELIAARPAFEGDRPAAVIAHVLEGEPPPLRLAPPGVRTVTAVCLNKPATARYADAGAVREELVRVLAGTRPTRRAPRRQFGAVLATTGVLVAVLAGISAWWARDPDRANVEASRPEAQRLADAGWALRRDDVQRGAESLQRACSLEPLRHDWRIRLGLLRWANGDDEAALATLRGVPPHADAGPRALWLQGLVTFSAALQHSDRTMAIEAVRTWQRVPPGSGPSATLAAAGIALVASERVEARQLLTGRHGWEADLIRGLVESSGRVRGLPWDPQAAVDAYTAALREGLRLPWALVNRASSYRAMGDSASALRGFDEAIRLHPTFRVALQGRAVLRRELGDVSGAVADRDALVRLRPDEPEPLVDRATVRLELGDMAGARADLEAALAIAPDSISARIQRGRMRAREGRLAAAREDYDAVLAARPENVYVLTNRSSVRRRLGDPAGALADLERAVAVDPEFFKARLYLAMQRMRGRDLAGALADYDIAIRLDPNHAIARANRASIRLAQDDLAGTLEDLLVAVRLDPEFPATQVLLGHARMRLGEFQEAVRAFRRFLVLAPEHEAAKRARAALRECESRIAAETR